MEEVAVPGPEGIKHIIHRWKPFKWGESIANRLDDLYPRMLRMPVAAQAGGMGEDEMQDRNWNYVQLTKLVR